MRSSGRVRRDPLARILDQLANNDDPLVADWARAMSGPGATHASSVDDTDRRSTARSSRRRRTRMKERLVEK